MNGHNFNLTKFRASLTKFLLMRMQTAPVSGSSQSVRDLSGYKCSRNDGMGRTATGLAASFIGVEYIGRQDTMPAYTDRTPVGGRPGGGYLVDPSSGSGGDNCAGLACDHAALDW